MYLFSGYDIDCTLFVIIFDVCVNVNWLWVVWALLDVIFCFLWPQRVTYVWHVLLLIWYSSYQRRTNYRNADAHLFMSIEWVSCRCVSPSGVGSHPSMEAGQPGWVCGAECQRGILHQCCWCDSKSISMRDHNASGISSGLGVSSFLCGLCQLPSNNFNTLIRKMCWFFLLNWLTHIWGIYMH